MNILIMLGVAAFSLCLLWMIQSVALVFVGEPLAWPLRFETRNPLVRWTSRIMIRTIWIIILVGTPLTLGISPVQWLHQQFPTPVPLRDIAVAFSIIVFPIWIMYALWIAAGWVRFEPQRDKATRCRKLFRWFIGSWLIATLEEAVFCGVWLEQLLRSFPQPQIYTVLAIVLSSAVFASVHFIKRPYPGKPVWQPAWGYFITGCLIGLAYIVGGRSLWLPIMVHGAAVFAMKVAPLYVVHRGPPWLLGYAGVPQCGLIGSMYVLGAAIALVVLF